MSRDITPISRLPARRSGMLAAAAFVAAGALGAAAASASYHANDTASDPAYNSGWTSGSNGGYGFQAWTLDGPGDSNGSHGGFFIGDSTANGGGGSGNPGSSGGINTTGAKSFGMYANSGQTVDAIRLFDGGGLATTDTLSFAMDNGYVANSGTVGISLRAGSTNRLEFYFKGGDADYTINDASGAHSSGIGYTDGGLTVSFTPTSASTYSLTVTPNGGSPTTFTGTLLGSPTSTDVDTFRAFDSDSENGTAGNFYVNSLNIVPEPTSLAMLGMLSAGMLVRRRKPRAI